MMDKGTIILTEKKVDRTEFETEASLTDIFKMISDIETKTKWKVKEAINDIIAEKMDSFSMRKDSPDVSLFIGGTIQTVSITFKSEDRVAEMSIPKRTNILPKD